MEEKCIDNNSEKNRFNVLYEQKSKIIFYDDLFLYQCYLNDGRNSKIEIHDIIFIKNLNESKDKNNDKINFKINNDIFINFNNDSGGENEFNNFEENYMKMKDNIKNNFPENYKDRFDLKKLFKYAEEI